jgi:hypothetical protein
MLHETGKILGKCTAFANAESGSSPDSNPRPRDGVLVIFHATLVSTITAGERSITKDKDPQRSTRQGGDAEIHASGRRS